MVKPKYFQISVTHYSSVLALKIRMRFGWSGYGVYLAVMQLLADTPDRIIHINDISQLAFQLRLDEKQLTEIITTYFNVVDDYFYSEELEESVAGYIKRLSKLNPSAGGKASAANMTAEERTNRAKKANAMRLANKVNGNGIEMESNVEESIEVESNVKESNVKKSNV